MAIEIGEGREYINILHLLLLCCLEKSYLYSHHILFFWGSAGKIIYIDS